MKTTSLIARFCLILLTVAAPVGAAAQPALQQRVEAVLAEAPQGTRFGLVVTDESGRELVAINPDGRFVPASNTKLLTTAAAYATLRGLDQPDARAGTSVRLEDRQGGPPDVVLFGRGDARLSSAADCVSNCLAALADAVAARTRRVNDVIGDARLFLDDRWSPGMSWNNIHTRSGTAVSSLSVDDNEFVIRVVPGAPDQPPTLDLLPYFQVVNRAVTRAGERTNLDFTRLPGSNVVALTGRIAAGYEPATILLGIDDPAHYAAWRLRLMLESRGVRVAGAVSVRRVGPDETWSMLRTPPLATTVPAPLAEDIVQINKVSQNLHAEMLLRRLGVEAGTGGSIVDGVDVVATMMRQAGAPRTGWDLSDGSGMSTYNRISPRAMIALLRWAATQPWGAAWRNSLPIGGVDGTLRSRFRGTPLEGRIFAKTGTINAANGLSGYLIAASGRTLTFAFFANDMPGGASATARMDAVLLAIAAAN